MSRSTNLLDAPRSRPPPPPLRTQKTSANTPLVLAGTANTSNQSLLYDLPTPTSPLGTTTRSAITSPTSPSFPSGPNAKRRSALPSPARKRNSTPLGVSRSDLEKFAEHCRAWYFNQDELAGRKMTQTLAELPPSHKAPYTRLQASIRSSFHASVNARRHAEFQAHISATQPGASLPAHLRADPASPAARKERFDRWDRFVRTWCTAGIPGTKPFFEALWAMMRLQVVPENLGGAGESRIQWEFDDAVFKEAAGKEFMLEAIDVLKGVLAFEEVQNSRSAANCDGLADPLLHSRSRSQPMPVKERSPTRNPPPVMLSKRGRAPSDPFLDMPTPGLSHSLSSASSQSSGATPPLPATNGDGADDKVRALYAASSPQVSTTEPEVDNLSPLRSDFASGDSEEQFLRTWTAPDLCNPEFLSLLSVFPPFITRRPLPRFPVSTGRVPDLEEGEDEREGKEIRFGTGCMWVGSKARSDGWKGDWWSRFVLWWRKLFC